MLIFFTHRWTFLLFVLFSLNISLLAQPYVRGGQTRHRFAQLNLGVDFRHFSAWQTQTFSQISPEQPWEAHSLNGSFEPRMVIGGTHFWGHADFYVAFPLGSFSRGEAGFKSGAETGVRAYPWRIEQGKLRPFIGFSWLMTSFEAGEGSRQIRNRVPIQMGLTYNHGIHLLEINGGIFTNNTENYHFDHLGSMFTTHLPKFWLGLGYKLFFDVTLKAERAWQAGATQRRTELFARQGLLNGISIGFGPSSSLIYGSSPHIETKAAYLGQHRMIPMLAEWTLGYYLHQPDVQIQVAGRTMRGKLQAYGHEQNIYRKSTAFEIYKFFGDFHGFVPFVGPSLSWETRQVTDQGHFGDFGEVRDARMGLVFGWDIRPNRLIAWYLRSHLRWYPRLPVTMQGSGQVVNMQQVEFNYIQLVVFPGRLLRRQKQQ